MLIFLMKKLSIFILVLFFSLNTTYAEDYNWSIVVSTTDGNTDFYIDKKSVRKVGKFHYFWMMADYIRLEQDDDPNIRSNITFNILNCKTNEFKMVTHTSFTSNKAKGRIDMDEIIPDFDISYFDWQYFNEDTSFGMVFKEVCKLGI
tara:strand:- start:126 stop:566 length:441 start_codon:yes stop_codon:yes gene_type:complete